jgi:energy-coupling factor transporter ATP-binding protein EcfA2
MSSQAPTIASLMYASYGGLHVLLAALSAVKLVTASRLAFVMYGLNAGTADVALVLAEYAALTWLEAWLSAYLESVNTRMQLLHNTTSGLRQRFLDRFARLSLPDRAAVTAAAYKRDVDSLLDAVASAAGSVTWTVFLMLETLTTIASLARMGFAVPVAGILAYHAASYLGVLTRVLARAKAFRKRASAAVAANRARADHATVTLEKRGDAADLLALSADTDGITFSRQMSDHLFWSVVNVSSSLTVPAFLAYWHLATDRSVGSLVFALHSLRSINHVVYQVGRLYDRRLQCEEALARVEAHLKGRPARDAPPTQRPLPNGPIRVAVDLRLDGFALTGDLVLARQVTVVTGPSGAGKSLLAAALAAEVVSADAAPAVHVSAAGRRGAPRAAAHYTRRVRRSDQESVVTAGVTVGEALGVLAGGRVDGHAAAIAREILGRLGMGDWLAMHPPAAPAAPDGLPRPQAQPAGPWRQALRAASDVFISYRAPPPAPAADEPASLFHAPIKPLSGGEKRRFSLAACLVSAILATRTLGTVLVLADEAEHGLPDEEVSAYFGALFPYLARWPQLRLLLITHAHPVTRAEALGRYDSYHVVPSISATGKASVITRVADPYAAVAVAAARADAVLRSADA